MLLLTMMVDAAAVHRRKAEEIRPHFNPRVRTGPGDAAMQRPRPKARPWLEEEAAPAR